LIFDGAESGTNVPIRGEESKQYWTFFFEHDLYPGNKINLGIRGWRNEKIISGDNTNQKTRQSFGAHVWPKKSSDAFKSRAWDEKEKQPLTTRMWNEKERPLTTRMWGEIERQRATTRMWNKKERQPLTTRMWGEKEEQPAITLMWNEKQRQPITTHIWNEKERQPLITRMWGEKERQPATTLMWNEKERQPITTRILNEKEIQPLTTRMWGEKERQHATTRMWNDKEKQPITTHMWDEKEKQVLGNYCGSPAAIGEDKFCALSLESMVDFAISKLGTNIKVISSSFTQNQNQYVVDEVNKIGDKAVMCHRLNFKNVVFYCHQVNATTTYMVPLVALDGTKAEVLTVCHHDTRGVDPDVLYEILKVKPGTVPICHFVGNKAIAWVTDSDVNEHPCVI